MSIRIAQEPAGSGPPYERCCFCWKPTTWWALVRNVAVCPSCAEVRLTKDVPEKTAWCEQTGPLSTPTTGDHHDR